MRLKTTIASCSFVNLFSRFLYFRIILSLVNTTEATVVVATLNQGLRYFDQFRTAKFFSSANTNLGKITQLFQSPAKKTEAVFQRFCNSYWQMGRCLHVRCSKPQLIKQCSEYTIQNRGG
jgi:hypothetical protein